MGHPVTLSPEAFPSAASRAEPLHRRPAPPSDRPFQPEDDRALARMLGASLLLGAGVTVGAGWGLCHVAVSLLS